MGASSDLSERRAMTAVAVLESAEVREIIRRALAEDGVFNDITTDALISPEQFGAGTLLAKEAGVIAGIPVAAAVFAEVDPGIMLTPLVAEGGRVQPGVELAHLRGRTSSILRAERVALNLLQRMSGIATIAARAVDLVSGLPVRVVDTRKTTPLMRALEKYAVRAGGGTNHRSGLDDGILIKDNHIRIVGSVADAVTRMRRANREMPTEVEAQSLQQVDEALQAGAEIVLLDNLSTEDIAEAVRRCRGRACRARGGRRRRLCLYAARRAQRLVGDVDEVPERLAGVLRIAGDGAQHPVEGRRDLGVAVIQQPGRLRLARELRQHLRLVLLRALDVDVLDRLGACLLGQTAARALLS